MDSKLPCNWFYKTQKDSTYYYLDSEGNYFQSKDAALKYHVKEKGENSETVQKLQNFINNIVPVYNKGHHHIAACSPPHSRLLTPPHNL
jgi:hypothetical protein